MGKGSRKYISLMELHNDNVEKELIEQDAYWGYLDVLCCNEEDYLYYEECADSYFVDKYSYLVTDFNTEHALITNQFPQPILKSYNEIYYEIDFNDVNKQSTHPMIQRLVEHFSMLSTVKMFKIYFMFHQRAWSNREVPKFEIIFSIDRNGMIYHRPSVLKLSNIFHLDAPAYADNGFKRLLFNDIQRRPEVYDGFDNIEELITNFEDYSWMVDAITC